MQHKDPTLSNRQLLIYNFYRSVSTYSSVFLQLKQAGILSNVDRKCDCIIYISFILKIGLFYEAKVK